MKNKKSKTKNNQQTKKGVGNAVYRWGVGEKKVTEIKYLKIKKQSENNKTNDQANQTRAKKK